MSKKIFRFNKTMRFFHWSYITFYFLLAITGAFLYFDFLDWLRPLFGGAQGARIVHRVAAVGLIVSPIISFLLNPKEIWETLKYAYSWKASDLKFFGEFIKEFFGGHAHYEPQGKYNQGEKLNIVLQSMGWLLFIVSGIVLWRFEDFSPEVGMIALIGHDIAFIFTLAYAIGHIYLSLFHPVTKPALEGMLTGYVDEEYAKNHHPLWYNEVKPVKGEAKKQAKTKSGFVTTQK